MLDPLNIRPSNAALLFAANPQFYNTGIHWYSIRLTRLYIAEWNTTTRERESKLSNLEH